MARLIDADSLKLRAIRVSTVKEHTYMKAVGTHEIDKAPTVNAVEVVRRKDCKHYVLQALACRHENFNGIIQMDGFCSYGERKDNG